MSFEATPAWKRAIEVSLGVLGVVGAVADLFSSRDWLLWVSAACFGVLAVILAFAVGDVDRHVRVMHSITDVIPGFDDDAAVFRRIGAHYSYLGVSGRSIFPAFSMYLGERRHGAALTARFLLIYPFTESVLINQRLSDPHATQADADRLSRTIENHAEEYLALNHPPLQVQVRFYRQSLHFWAHFLDAREAVVGIRLSGESGLRPTALHLRRRRHPNGLLTLFEEEFDDLWNAPDTVDAAEYFARKASTPAVAP